MNRNNLAHEIGLQVMNLTGDKEYGWGYDYRKDEPKRYSGTGTVPNLYYKIEF